MLKYSVRTALILIAVLALGAMPARAGQYDLTMNFSEFTPHLGQKFELRVIDKATGEEVARAIRLSVPAPDFQVNLPGALDGGKSYTLEFFADDNYNGVYDDPPTDHSWRTEVDSVSGNVTINYAHNTNFAYLDFPPGDYTLSITFSSMTPHLGQMFRLRVKDDSSLVEVADTTIAKLDSVNFTLNFGQVLVNGHTYRVDFYADLNGNGRYDTPPVDHAWRLMAQRVTSNTQLSFSHNTTFTDVMYDQNDYDLKLVFTGMTPHVGQTLMLRVVDTLTAEVVADTVIDPVPAADFTLDLGRCLKAFRNYNVDFFADFKKNGRYDPPPVDHAWRIKVSAVYQDVISNFVHNTNFTDIQFPVIAYGLTINFTGMTPHVGQLFKLRVVDDLSLKTVSDTVIASLPGPDFQLLLPGALLPGRAYHIDFYADLNKNSRYDSPPADHAWRMTVKDALADTTLNFAHNTTFTDVNYPDAKYDLSLAFTGMTPHVGQLLELRVINDLTGSIVADTMLAAVPTADFSLMFAQVLTEFQAYRVDFYADLNKNGMYDIPPTDHAWRLQVPTVTGNVALSFAHNTSFTDVGFGGDYYLTLQFRGMTPHVGQLFQLRVLDSLMGVVVADTTLLPITSADFDLPLGKVLSMGHSYRVDFWADLNKNRMYDSPPADHAWRLWVSDASADDTVLFQHNTKFTDVQYPAEWADLDIDFTGMTPHIGQLLQLRVVDSLSGSQVADTSLAQVADADFELYLDGILKVGRNYQVDFYADLNKNGMYDAPPVDHAWRLWTGGVLGDVTLDFAHNTTFTDVQYPSSLPAGRTCDFTGDGETQILDVIALLIYARNNPQDLKRLDWNANGEWDIGDAVVMLRNILGHTCPSPAAQLAASNAQPAGSDNTTLEISPEQKAWLGQMIAQMGLTPEESEAMLLALNGASAPAELPRAFSLSQNSPNPFNPSTTLSYEVPGSAAVAVSLRVFNIRGALVRTLVDEARDPGSYTLFWDGTDNLGHPLASGVYLYRMRAGQFSQTRKMVLLK